jgi:hypothetical protein
VANLIDTGWAAWLPNELIAAHEARQGGSAARRALRKRLADGPGDADRARWERFAVVCPSRIDLPPHPADLTEEGAYGLLDALGLLDADPEPVELVLTLDHEDVRELEAVRSARDPGAAGAGGIPADMPALDNVLGGGATGRNEPCPCGSGKKFKRCHGR